MQANELAAEYGVSEQALRDACRTLGIEVADDGEVDDLAFRREIATRQAAPAATLAEPATPAAEPATAAAELPTPAAAPPPPPVTTYVAATPQSPHVADEVVQRTVPLTPALLAGLALIAAFFMPFVSGFGGLLTLSSWSYLRLLIDVGDDLSVADWIVAALLPATVLLAVGVVVTEARHRRSRLLLAATGLVPIGLVIYGAMEAGSLEDFRHADIAGYVGVAAALVLLTTAFGAFDKGPREFRTTVYAICALLVVAGIAVPATGSSLTSDFGQVAEGFESSLNESFDDDSDESADDSAQVAAGTIDPAALSSAVAAQLAEENDLDTEPIVDCPEEIDRKVGTTTTCTFEIAESEDDLRLTVTVTSVDGDDVEFELEVGQ